MMAISNPEHHLSLLYTLRLKLRTDTIHAAYNTNELYKMNEISFLKCVLQIRQHDCFVRFIVAERQHNKSAI
jgi:hypothetical protein